MSFLRLPESQLLVSPRTGKVPFAQINFGGFPVCQDLADYCEGTFVRLAVRINQWTMRRAMGRPTNLSRGPVYDPYAMANKVAPLLRPCSNLRKGIGPALAQFVSQIVSGRSPWSLGFDVLFL